MGSSPITRSNRNILPNGGIFLLELKLRGLEGRIRKGACDAFSRPGERMERPRGQGGAQPSSEMSGESHYPLQQKYPPEWGDIFVEMMIGEWDSKGTSRPQAGKNSSGGGIFSSPGWRRHCPSAAGSPITRSIKNKPSPDGLFFLRAPLPLPPAPSR